MKYEPGVGIGIDGRRSEEDRAGRGRLAAVERHATVVSVWAPCYIGVEALRLWLSDIHIACGLALPLLILVHVLVGRRTG